MLYYAETDQGVSGSSVIGVWYNLNIFLIGPMGAGKSTIGRLLSHELNLEFIDSDREIEARAGANIPWIFDVEGESGFREREESVIRDLCERDNIVLATGGGAVLREANRAALQSHGVADAVADQYLAMAR